MIFATLSSVTIAIGRIFFTRLFIEVEFLLPSQSDLVVEPLSRQLVGIYNPKLIRKAKMIMVDQEEVFIVNPDKILKAWIHIKNQSIFWIRFHGS